MLHLDYNGRYDCYQYSACSLSFQNEVCGLYAHEILNAGQLEQVVDNVNGHTVVRTEVYRLLHVFAYQ